MRPEQFSILAFLWTIWRFLFFSFFFCFLLYCVLTNFLTFIFLQYRRNLRTNRFGGNCFRLPFFSERKSLNSIKKNGSDIKRFRAGNKFLIACNYWRSKSLYTSHPSSIYSWSISHILEHEFFCLGRRYKQEIYILVTVFPHIVSAETILFRIWKSKGHST